MCIQRGSGKGKFLKAKQGGLCKLLWIHYLWLQESIARMASVQGWSGGCWTDALNEVFSKVLMACMHSCSFAESLVIVLVIRHMCVRTSLRDFPRLHFVRDWYRWLDFDSDSFHRWQAVWRKQIEFSLDLLGLMCWQFSTGPDVSTSFKIVYWNILS